MPRITTSGAIFLGNYSPVAVGDFLAGPSHELPTGGAGKSFPGLTVDMFQRRTSIVRLDRESIRKSAPIVEAFAKVEGLDAHGRSATIRVEYARRLKGSGTCQCSHRAAPALTGPTTGILGNSATNEKNWQRLRISSSAVSCGNGS